MAATALHRILRTAVATAVLIGLWVWPDGKPVEVVPPAPGP